METTEIMFYLTVVNLAALTSLCRVFKDSKYDSFSSLFGLCGCSGLLAFALIAFFFGDNGGYVGVEFRCYALATIIGFMGKEQDQLLKFLFKKIAGMLGVEDENISEE